MKSLKRAQNQKKKKQSKQSKQRGAIGPDSERSFNVYYNYRLARLPFTPNFDGRHGVKFTRQLDARELSICQEWMTVMRDSIIHHVRGGEKYNDLHIGLLEQLPLPRDDFFHFKIVISVKNKTEQESIQLIYEYMQQVSISGYMELDNEFHKVSIGCLPSEGVHRSVIEAC
jgi:hypothetical protein